MTLSIDVLYDEDPIVSLSAEHDGYFYAWKFGGKLYEFEPYEGAFCDGTELELTGLPDKEGKSRWTFQGPDGYSFNLSEPVDIDMGFVIDEHARMVLR